MSSERLCTSAPIGRYWISSITRLRQTTAPGVFPTFLPTGKLRAFACAGCDASQLAEKCQIVLGGRDGIAQHLCEQQTCRIENVLPAHAHQRIGRQRVMRRLFADVILGSNWSIVGHRVLLNEKFAA